MYKEKTIPYDTEAEQATIGSILIDPEAICKVDMFLKTEDFYNSHNGIIYNACKTLYSREEKIDQITVARELVQNGKLKEIGGTGYLATLIANTPTSVNIEYYGRIISRLAVMRKLIKAGSRIAEIGYDAPADIKTTIAKAESVLFDVCPDTYVREFESIKDILENYLNQSLEDKEKIGEVATGFQDLDRVLKHLQRSDLIIIGARPSIGKSSLALSIARNVAVEQKGKVAIFSLEMSSEQLARRLLASESGVMYDRIDANVKLDDAEESKVMKAIGVLSDTEIYIDDSPRLLIDQIYNKTRRLNNEVKIDLLIIDYIQLVYATDRIQNSVQEMTLVSRSLKEIARDFNIPVIALSQLNRAVESRMKPRIPQLSDLRESGSIEQDADVVMLMYRADKDYTEDEWRSEHPNEHYPIGITEIDVAKHRNGATGKSKLYFRDNLTKFNSIDIYHK